MDYQEEIKALYRRIYRLRRLMGVCYIAGCNEPTNGAARCKEHAKKNLISIKKCVARKKKK